MLKVTPYLYFNGNCAEAIALYQKAFNVKVEEIWPYEEGSDLVAHADFEIGGDPICLCDAEQPVTVGNNTMIAIQFDAEDESDAAWAKTAFDTLKESGEVIEELEENSWNKCHGILVDKFGLRWQMCGGMKE